MTSAPIITTLNYGDREAPQEFPNRHTKVPVEMLNGRLHGKECDASGLSAQLDSAGFCLITDAPMVRSSEVGNATGLEDANVVDAEYMPFIELYLQRAMGCHSVTSVNHVHRKSGTSKALPDGSTQNVPARGETTGAIANVHADYTSDALLVQLMRKVVDDDPATKGGRFVLVNCWRPLSTVHRWPLAVCDASSVVDDEDLYRRETPENNNTVANCFPENAMGGNHKWHYFPTMSPAEMIVFKQWDEDRSMQHKTPGVADHKLRGVARQTLHSAFDLPAPPEAPARSSLEARFCCIWKAEVSSKL
jgi:hypothetical protein